MDRNEAYQTLAELIFKGFITSEAVISKQRLVLKTITEREFDLIRAYSGSSTRKEYQLTFNIYFIIFSLFMVNNQNILFQRTEKMPDLFDLVAGFPKLLLFSLLIKLSALRTTAIETLKYLEGFSYTNFSRNAWKALNGHFPTESLFTGIPGTDGMGMNVHQESWVLINRSLDDEEQYNTDFDFSLMIASSNNSQGARKIRNNYETRVRGLEDRRKKIASEGFIDTQKWSPDGWAVPVDTVEELVAELEREMQGHKDKHDVFIEKYLKGLRTKAEQKAQEAEERIKKAREGREYAEIDGFQRALTPEETRQLLNKKKIYTQIVHDEEHTSPADRERFLRKTGARVLGR